MENRKLWWVAAICFIIALVYLVMPIDFIPDLIVGIGWLDDLLVSLLGLGGLVMSILGAMGILPTPQSADGWQRDYENYGEYREV